MRKRRKDFIQIEIGSVFGTWTVIGDGEYRVHKRGANHYPLCRCECGTERLVRKQNLTAGLSSSCGCRIPAAARKQMTGSVPPNKLLPGEAARNRVIYSYKRNAIAKQREWGLSDDECIALFAKPCQYCNIVMAQAHTGSSKSTTFRYNGIDRVDNSRGYVPDNVAPCCETCNKAKRTMSVEAFLEWIRAVYNHSCTNGSCDL